MLYDPLGIFDTWGGVGIDREVDGVKASFVGYGYGNLTCHGETLSLGVPVRVMTVPAAGMPWDARLVLDVRFESLGGIRGLPGGRTNLRVMWQDYTDGLPEGIQLEQAAEVCP